MNNYAFPVDLEPVTSPGWVIDGVSDDVVCPGKDLAFILRTHGTKVEPRPAALHDRLT
jgi:hypothetical protein